MAKDLEAFARLGALVKIVGKECNKTVPSSAQFLHQLQAATTLYSSHSAWTMQISQLGA
jgi:hypothetical protein